MKSKTTILMVVLSALLVLYLTNFVSAATLTLTPVNIPAQVSHDAGSFILEFDLTNTGVADSQVSFAGSTITSGTAQITRAPISIADGTTTPFTRRLSATVTFEPHQSGQIAGKIVADDSGSGAPREFTFNVNILEEPSLEITKVQDISATGGRIKVENTGNIDLTRIQLTQSGDFTITLADDEFSLSAGDSTEIAVRTADLTNLKFGVNKVTISARDTLRNAQDTLELTFTKGFCRDGSAGGKLAITDVKINSRGDDDDEWKPLDIIEVEVDVENQDNDEDVDDIFLELGLFDSNGNNQAGDLDFENEDDEEIDFGNLGDDDEDTVTFVFQIPADFDEGSYKLTLKAYSDDLGESNECVDSSSDLDSSFYESIRIDKQDDDGKQLAFDNFEFNPSQAVCGENVALTFDTFNVGDDTQDRARVTLSSTDLNLDESVEINQDLDEGDSEEVRFTFKIPDDLEDGTYALEVSAEYDYSRGSYRETLDDPATVLINVLGCSVPDNAGGSGRSTLISAVLDSDAAAGSSMVVRATITNLLNTDANIVVSASGYESWASAPAISRRVLELGPGDTEEVTLTFNVDSDADGQQSFILETRSGEAVETREVAVNIASPTSSPQFNFGDNGLLWVIGIINVVLIILIIIVAVRISSRK